MFKCEITGKLSQPEEKSFKLVTKTREKEYKRQDKYGREKVVATGWEIVEEKTVCAEVYNKLKG